MVVFNFLNTVQFGELGIDFVGLEPSSSPPSSKDVNTDTMVGSMLPYSDLQQRYVQPNSFIACCDNIH